ncbi:geraniol 8-hydroxylase-like protein [Tanacetum coccineum]
MASNSYGSWLAVVSGKKDEFGVAGLVVMVMTLAFSLYKRSILSYRKGTPPLPPGPTGLPVVGYLPFLSPNLHHEFTKMAQHYGPIFKLYLGSKLHVVVNSAELAKVVTGEQDESFANRDPHTAGLSASYDANDIAWSKNSANWRKLRKVLVHEVLSNMNLEASHSYRRVEVRKTIKNVHDMIGTSVDINEISFSTVLSVLTNFVWGKGFAKGAKDSNLSDEIRKVVSGIVEIAEGLNISDFFPTLARFDLQELKDQISATSINMTQLKAIVVDMFLGGTDATSAMVEWTMTEVLQNPEVMRKIQHELTEVVGLNNIVEESHLPKLKYLDAVFKETFRLHPPLPFLLPRAPSKTCTVGGYAIPESSIVFMNVWAIQRDPQHWDNPSMFKPERRRCPGVPLGEKMMMHILASLLHSFEWKFPMGEELDLSDKFGIALKKRKPLIVVPTQRLTDLSLYV